MLAADAQRLREDTSLRSVVDAIRARANSAAIYDADVASREQARLMVIGIDSLWAEIQNRIDTVIEIERRQLMDRIHE